MMEIVLLQYAHEWCSSDVHLSLHLKGGGMTCTTERSNNLSCGPRLLEERETCKQH
jgi:hypothetical protein